MPRIWLLLSESPAKTLQRLASITQVTTGPEWRSKRKPPTTRVVSHTSCSPSHTASPSSADAYAQQRRGDALAAQRAAQRPAKRASLEHQVRSAALASPGIALQPLSNRSSLPAGRRAVCRALHTSGGGRHRRRHAWPALRRLPLRLQPWPSTSTWRPPASLPVRRSGSRCAGGQTPWAPPSTPTR